MLNPRSFTLPMAGLSLCFSLAAATTPTFEADVQPIFAAKCVMCHGAAPQGKLDLRTQQSVLNGGASGPAVLPGESAKSLLLTKVVTRQMPPGSAKLTDAEIDRIRIWIDKGLAPEAPVTVSENEVRAIFSEFASVLCTTPPTAKTDSTCAPSPAGIGKAARAARVWSPVNPKRA